jgi:hypothetical protein
MGAIWVLYYFLIKCNQIFLIATKLKLNSYAMQVAFLKLVLGTLCLGTSIFQLVMGITFLRWF